jgi:hypothetical protein
VILQCFCDWDLLWSVLAVVAPLLDCFVWTICVQLGLNRGVRLPMCSVGPDYVTVPYSFAK